jgi:SET domain-containing protein
MAEDTRIVQELEARPSSIHGSGLFALRVFEAGEIVLRWDVSHLISNEQLSSLTEHERKYTHPFDEKTTILMQAPACLVNHCCDNNTVVRDFCDVAIRRIEAGEEITSDYSSDGSGSGFDCSCGSKNCRGAVKPG